MTPKKPQSGYPSLQNSEKYVYVLFCLCFWHEVHVISGLVDRDVDKIEQANA